MRSTAHTMLLGTLGLATLAGCASSTPRASHIPSAKAELIEITTVPEGVNVEVPGHGTVRTPANVYLDPAEAHELRFYLHGFDDRFITIDSNIGEWTAHATGRTHALEPAFIHLDMASGERLMTGGELSAWATAEADQALKDARSIQGEVSQLVETERAAFDRTERALAEADRAIARAEAIIARDESREAVAEAIAARERATALLDEQMGLEAIALDHLNAAQALVESAHQEKLAMIQLTERTAEINAAATEQERMIAIMRGVIPPETLEEALVNALPSYRDLLESLRSGEAFGNSQPSALTEVPGDAE